MDLVSLQYKVKFWDMDQHLYLSVYSSNSKSEEPVKTDLEEEEPVPEI